MKLGLAIGYSGAELRLPVEQDPARGAPRLRLGVDGGGLRLRRHHAAGLSGRADQAHPPRHRHHAARRAPARRGGHGAQARSTPSPAAAASSPGSACPGPQIVEGWYGQPWGKPYWRLRDYVADHAQDLRAQGAGGPRRAARSRCRTPGPARPASASRCVDPPREPARCRSGSARAPRRTSSSPPSCATAGCRWTSCRAGCRCCGPGWRRASAAPGGGKGLARLRDPGAASQVAHHRRRARARWRA